jgi:hypothetical protein
MARRSWKWSLPGIVLVALLAAFFNPPDQTATHGDFDVVERVVDGDTLLLPSGQRVRLIGAKSILQRRRFKLLSDFNNKAVLDRETGIVWERQISYSEI